MIAFGLEGEPAPVLIRILWGTSAACETNAVFLQNRKRMQRSRIARPSKSDRCWNSMFLTTLGDSVELFCELRNVRIADTQVIARVVADLKAIAMELSLSFQTPSGVRRFDWLFE